MNYINDILNKKCISKQITVNTDYLLDKELDFEIKRIAYYFNMSGRNT